MAKPFAAFAWVILFIQLARSPAQKQRCSAQWPVAIPPSADVNVPEKIAGIWYMYREKSRFGSTSVFNQHVQWDIITQTVDTSTNQSAWAVTAQFAMNDAGGNRSCENHFWTGLYTVDGRMRGTMAATEDNLIMREVNLSILYHDYNKMLVAYGCIGPNQDGSCTTPLVIVQVRANLSSLSASDMDDLDSTLNTLFAAYCITANDIPQQRFDSRSPCLLIDSPDCTAKDIQGLRLLGNLNISDPSTPNCRLPNAIASEAVLDPQQLTGSWSGYTAHLLGGPPYSLSIKWHSIGRSPSTSPNITSQLMWMEYFYASPGSTHEFRCSYGYYIGEVRSDGQLNGRVFEKSLGVPDARRVLSLSTVYQDANITVFYGCLIPNPVTGICSSWWLLAATRTSTSDFTFHPVIDAFLSKYGACGDTRTLFASGVIASTCTSGSANDTCLQQSIPGLQEGVVRNHSSTSPASY
ncbi:uncharacterized protein LOC129592867 [Paramacrobiotus metropolitanus]|uniref:uncharacterized protein LOC129592867 n=1 Tax=Paramacrobiotus metropolitanus TaxID=2943436 RepID=UPI0024459258|nr:uncharacterized protein LOC129592867 [Paramacrobiotus metropolitanus]